MRKIFIALFAFVLLQNSAAVIAQSALSPSAAQGKLIIVGGGSMPDTMYQLFAKSIGGKDQSVVVIPTATNDSAINAGAHLTRFKKEGFTRNRCKCGVYFWSTGSKVCGKPECSGGFRFIGISRSGRTTNAIYFSSYINSFHSGIFKYCFKNFVISFIYCFCFILFLRSLLFWS